MYQKLISLFFIGLLVLPTTLYAPPQGRGGGERANDPEERASLIQRRPQEHKEDILSPEDQARLAQMDRLENLDARRSEMDRSLKVSPALLIAGIACDALSWPQPAAFLHGLSLEALSHAAKIRYLSKRAYIGASILLGAGALAGAQFMPHGTWRILVNTFGWGEATMVYVGLRRWLF